MRKVIISISTSSVSKNYCDMQRNEFLDELVCLDHFQRSTCVSRVSQYTHKTHTRAHTYDRQTEYAVNIHGREYIKRLSFHFILICFNIEIYSLSIDNN